MPNSANVDWDNVVAGGNANGEVEFMSKLEADLASSGYPNCSVGRVESF